MYKKYINKLEFNKILDILSNYCITDLGKDISNTLMPSTNKDIVLHSLNETNEAVTLIYKKRKS